MKRVSIVTPVYNGAEFLAITLDSARAQTYADVEIIVVDDGSSDDSFAIAAARATRCERVAHGGAGRAKNRGLELATGHYVLFLDSDDLVSPDYVAALVRALESAPPCSFAIAPWQKLVRCDGVWRAMPAEARPAPPGDDELAAWLFTPAVSTSGLLWPVELVRELGGWDGSLTLYEDVDLVARALLAGAHPVRASSGMLSYRMHGAGGRSMSQGRSAEHVGSALRMAEKLEAALRGAGRFEAYRVTVARLYHKIARCYFAAQPELARECARRAKALAGRRAIEGPFWHRILVRAVGLERKERLAAALAGLGIGRAARLGAR
jgi:glycosyltransferase involved in cell wall biosynthesis